MYFLVDSKNKVIFGWSAKCGCSHIKTIFWFLQNNSEDNQIHTVFDDIKLPHDIENYTTIVISRNPYKRIVSGFLNKYKMFGEFRYLWKHDNLTFSMFIDELVENNWTQIDYHHFTPQTSENFDLKILQSKCIKFYDIENIDYNYIENLYNIKIPENLINKKYGHERCFAIVEKDKYNDIYVYDLNMDEYIDYNVDIKYFYNKELKNRIYKLYEDDFKFFYENGIDYINSPFLGI